MSTERLLLLLVALLLGTAGHANETTEAPVTRPVVGLVLSGGGAKGLAHVGVLRVLEEIKVPVDLIVGTSAGSAVAALYALGMPVDEIEDRFVDMNWLSSFQDSPGRAYKPVRRKQEDWRYPVTPGIGLRADGVHLGRGLISGQNLGFILNELTRDAALVKDFDQLPIPFRAVATDLETGRQVVIGDGHLAEAVRASMSIPGVYAPVSKDGRLLVDGGVANNIPVSVAQQMGAEVVIVVDISDTLAAGDSLAGAFSVVNQLTTLMTRLNSEAQLERLSAADVLIQPDLEAITSADFYDAPIIIERGATSARKRAVALNRLSVDAAAWQRYTDRRRRRQFEPGLITDITVNKDSRLSAQFISSRVSQRIGEPLDVQQLEEDLKQIYGLGYYETVAYSLAPADGGSVLELDVDEKSWGPNYLSFGLGYEDTFTGDTHFNIAAALRMTELNARGGEWLTGVQLGTEPYVRTEWFQPLDYSFHRFVIAGAEYEQRNLNGFDGAGNRISEVNVARSQADFAFGYELETRGELRLGLTRGYATTDGRFGGAPGGDTRVSRGSWHLRYLYDTMDDAHLPGEGRIVGLKTTFERPGLGGERDYDRVTAIFSEALQWRQYHLVGLLYADTVVRGEAGVEDYVLLGGFRRLSSFSHGEIAGQDAALVSVFGYRKFGGPFVPYFAGAGVETGNAWDSLADIRSATLLRSWSLFAGIDTFLGPVQVAGAYNNDTGWSGYLKIGYSLGRLFD
ncbi:patatin-like phospholipase family protein [Marinobacter sp. X15-166B]|uniref:patatin-like phospholipase family protein n=1 Tax=Marinobacter sp. X15-166B TaxID=1897620 RepID=UPI001D17CAE6|nr:patatin-like phospholipase family protein [Marinobacter sp. X15-166B]